MEREEVSLALPMVEVLDSSGDPLRPVGMVSQYSGFDSLRPTRIESALIPTFRKSGEAKCRRLPHRPSIFTALSD